MKGNALPDKEIKVIKWNGMLTDLTIDKYQKILENQFHAKNELQDTILGQNLCSMNKTENSQFHEEIRDHVKIQNCNIFKCSGKELTVDVKVCQ